VAQGKRMRGVIAATPAPSPLSKGFVFLYGAPI
jgi:hypothetical protein